MDVQKAPSNYVLISAFDDVESSEKVLKKLKVEATCFFGNDLVEKLGVSQLPWSKRI